MTFFKLFTPVSYWLLIILWLFIFIFYVNRIVNRKLESKLFVSLLIILAIDAFRTLFESVYFGAWYTSLVGLIPKTIHTLLVQPENVFIPKILNLIAAILVIFIVLRRWIPEEESEREREKKYLVKLEQEIDEREQAQKALTESENRLVEAQKLAKVGHYVLNIKSGHWQNSPELDNIFGISKMFKKDVAGWEQIVHPDFREKMSTYLKDTVLTRKEKFDKKYKIVHFKTKKEAWVHGIGDLRFDEDGNPSEMFGTIQDITQEMLVKKEHENLIKELQEALEKVKVLSGLVPICSNCKKIRDDKGYWNHLETYIQKHSDVLFSHGMCEKCSDELYGDQKWYIKMKEDKKDQ